MSGPYEGIRIVDATAMLAGPWATSILGDQGADVIKVEVPGRGDHVRSLGNRRGGLSSIFLNINRNKRSITLDLKTPEGRDLLLRIAETADVFVQNFRPGVVPGDRRRPVPPGTHRRGPACPPVDAGRCPVLPLGLGLQRADLAGR